MRRTGRPIARGNQDFCQMQVTEGGWSVIAIINVINASSSAATQASGCHPGSSPFGSVGLKRRLETPALAGTFFLVYLTSTCGKKRESLPLLLEQKNQQLACNKQRFPLGNKLRRCKNTLKPPPVLALAGSKNRFACMLLTSTSK